MTEASTHYLRKHDNISLFPQDRCIHHFVEEQALVRANAVALIDRCKTYTYEKVNQRANQVARYIHSLNLPEESIIAVMFDRSAEMIYSMLGVLKAGHAFLPIDPDYPSERINYVLADSQAALLITHSYYVNTIDVALERIVLLDKEINLISSHATHNLNLTLSSRKAFIIYTSGSTGKPKGVLNEHRSLCNLNQAKRQTCYVHEKTVLLQAASIGFDAAVWEWTSALMGGGQLVLESKVNLLPGPALVETLRRHKVTILMMCPTALIVFQLLILTAWKSSSMVVRPAIVI